MKKLWGLLPDDDHAQYLLMHLQSCVELYGIVINPVLNPSFPIYIQQWRDTFDVCFDAALLTETEKCHYIYAEYHLELELTRTNLSLWPHDTQGVEKTHSSYLAFQKEHGFEVWTFMGCLNYPRYS